MKEFKLEKESGLKCSCGETEEHLLITDKEKHKAKCRKCAESAKMFVNVPKENF